MRRPLLLALIAGLFGFLLNSLPIKIVPGVTMVFGAIFTLPIAFLYGPVYGVLAALIGSSRLIPLWGHPLPLLIFGLEALAMGWLVSRKKFSPFLAILIYWLAVGLPLMIVLYPVITGTEEAWAIVIKLPLNALIDVIVIEIFFLLTPLRRGIAPHRLATRSLRVQDYLFRVFMLVAALPLLFLSFMHGQAFTKRQFATADARLHRAGASIAKELELFLDLHVRAIKTLANEVMRSPNRPGTSITQLLASYRSQYPGFKTMIAADSLGNIVAAHPETTLDGSKPILDLRENISDREYFQQAKKTGRSFISNVFKGRGFGNDPIIAISAPLIEPRGRFVGIVEGSLTLDRFLQFEQHLTALAETELIIIDRVQNVVYASEGSIYAFLQNLSHSSLIASLNNAQPGLYPGTFHYQIMPSDSSYKRYLVSHSEIPSVGWRIFVQQPTARIQADIEKFYKLSSFWFFIAIALALAMAGVSAHTITAPLRWLVMLIQSYRIGDKRPEDLESHPEFPKEVNHLLTTFNDLTGRLNNSYRQLQRTIAERDHLNTELQDLLKQLDQKVQLRTEELAQERQKAEQSEKRYKSLVQGIEAIVWEIDEIEGKFTFVSERAEAILGYPLQDWLENPDLWKHIVHPEDRDRILALRREHFQNRQNYTCEYRAHTRDGLPIWLRDVVRFVEEPPGHWQIHGLTLDVTVEKNREEEHKRMQEKLLEAQKMESIGRLAGGIAHDFNNLLAAIVGFAEVARHEMQANNRDDENIVEILKAAMRARELTQQLLALGRKRVLNLRVVSLNEELAHMANLLNRLFDYKLHLKLELEPNLYPILADQTQIEQIIMNLALNARDAMPEGGMLTIETTNVSTSAPDLTAFDLEPRAYVRLRFRDTGTGMDEATLKHIFEPFFSTKPHGKGTGLGLSVVYGLVHQHQGQIHVQSEPGKGSVFDIYIPAHTGDQPTETNAQPGEPKSQKQSATILLVDDEEIVLKMAARLLRRKGHRVFEFNDPLQALDFMSGNEQGIDLLLTDIIMPKMNGKVLYEKLAEADPHLRVLYMSGYTSDVLDMEYGVSIPGLQFLQKPFTSEELTRKVQETLYGAFAPLEESI